MDETEEPLNIVAKQFVTVGECDKKQEVMEIDKRKRLFNQGEEAAGKKDDEDIALGDDDRGVSFFLEAA